MTGLPALPPARTPVRPVRAGQPDRAGRAGSSAIACRAAVRAAIRAGLPPIAIRAAVRAGFPSIVARAAVRATVLILALTGTVAGSPAVSGAGAAVFTPEWSWPLAPVPEVLRPFEKPPQQWKRGHRGVDLSGSAGGPAVVLSPADGVVSFAGTVVDRGVLSIDHGGGRMSSFEPVTTDLVKGRRVGRGDVVAMLAGPAAGGPSGHCGQPCLHWGVRVDGDYVDPLSFVMDRRPSVLLPLGGGGPHRETGRGWTVPRPTPSRAAPFPRRRRRCP